MQADDLVASDLCQMMAKLPHVSWPNERAGLQAPHSFSLPPGN